MHPRHGRRAVATGEHFVVIVQRGQVLQSWTNHPVLEVSTVSTAQISWLFSLIFWVFLSRLCSYRWLFSISTGFISISVYLSNPTLHCIFFLPSSLRTSSSLKDEFSITPVPKEKISHTLHSNVLFSGEDCVLLHVEVEDTGNNLVLFCCFNFCGLLLCERCLWVFCGVCGFSCYFEFIVALGMSQGSFCFTH